LKVPVLCIVIGEGASGGALGIGVGDKLLMLGIPGIRLFLPNHVLPFYGVAGISKILGQLFQCFCRFLFEIPATP